MFSLLISKKLYAYSIGLGFISSAYLYNMLISISVVHRDYGPAVITYVIQITPITKVKIPPALQNMRNFHQASTNNNFRFYTPHSKVGGQYFSYRRVRFHKINLQILFPLYM